MAEKDAITTKFKVDISDLKRGITEANQQIKLANSAFKAASNGTKEWEHSSEGLNAKITQLKSVLDAQNQKLRAYQQELEKAKKYEKESSDEVERLKKELEKAKSEYGENSSEIRKLEKELTEAEQAEQAMHTQVNNLTVTMNNQQGTVNRTASELNHLESELEDVEKAEKEASDNSADLGNALEDAQSESKNASSGFSTMKGALANLVADGIRNAISALKDMVAETINVGKQFDSTMSEVKAISGSTGKEYDALRAKAKEMGAKTKFSASEAGEAMTYMAMAGWKSKDMIDGIEGIMNLAAASGEDLATTSDIVTDGLTAMGYSAKDAGKLADVMAAASSNANTNVSMMGETFKYAAAVGGSYGYSMEDIALATGLMANAGIKASQSGTALRSIMSRLATDAGASKNKLGALGTMTKILGVQFYNTDGTMRDFSDVLEDARVSWKFLTKEEQANYGKMIAGQNALSGWLALMNSSDADFKKLSGAINNSSGAAKKMSDTMQDNLGGDLTTLGSKFEGVQIAIYEKFEPALRKGVDALKGLVDGVSWIISHSEDICTVLKGMASGVMAYVVATSVLDGIQKGWKSVAIAQNIVAVGQKILTAGQAAFNAVSNLNPWGIAIAALVAAFIILWKKSDAFREFWINLWNKIKEITGEVVDAIAKWFSDAWDDIKSAWSAVGSFFSGIWEGIKSVFSTVGEFFTNTFSTVVTAIQSVWSTIVEWFSTYIVEPLKMVFAPFIAYYTFIFTEIRDFIKSVVLVVVEIVQGCWIMIKTIWGAVAGWFNTNVITPWRNIFSAVWNFIKSAAQGAWNGIVAIWRAVAGWFNANVITPWRNIFSAVWNFIKSAAQGAWNGIKNIFGAVAGWFNTRIKAPLINTFTVIWNTLKTKAQAAWEGIKSVFSKVATFFGDIFSKAWTKVKNVFSTGGKIFDGIKEGIVSTFKSIVNKIIRGINKVVSAPINAINKVLGKIQGVSVAGVKPFSGLVSRIDPIQIPTLQTGGILKRGQVGILEGKGDEAVVPLHQNKKWISAVAKSMRNELNGATAYSGDLGGTTSKSVSNFTQVINSPKALSRIELYRQTKNLLNLVQMQGGS